MHETLRLVLSCEHGGNLVPFPYRPLFEGREALLQSHRGFDIGILPLARLLARKLEVPLHATQVTRLLVDLNRSLTSPTLFTEISRGLGPAEQEGILRRYYHPYRQAVADRVGELLDGGQAVCHLSIHSFTPVLNEKERRADLGLLYDPARASEKAFCRLWRQELLRLAPELRVRRNHPYRGTSDSLTRDLRERFPAERYLGIELEVNQKFPLREAGSWKQLQNVLVRSLERHPQL